MRNGLSALAPLALVAGLVVACSGAERRSGFDTSATDGGTTGGFNNVDAGAGQDGCSEAKTEISRIPVVIQFVVDDSGSMDTSNYWTSARDALLAAFEDMHATADPATFVGSL